MELITQAIPVFLLLIGVELVVSIRRRQRVYRFNDSINDLSMGISQQVLGAFFLASIFAVYLYLYEFWRLFEIPESAVWAWLLCIVIYDMQYYWAHRTAHTVNILWGSHLPHHQSEEYNFTVALRQGAFQGPMLWVFFLPLALIGFPPAMFLTAAAIDSIYQFWIHTRLVNKLGPLEWVFNTPSHHRVHHAKNPRYLDKNFGGILIVWDRLFGTFEPETEEPRYGVVKPLRSWNPMWALVHHWVYLGRLTWYAPRWRDKWRVWWAPPGFTPTGLPPAEPTPEESLDAKKYDPRVPLGLNLYVLVQFAPVIAATLVFLLTFSSRLLSEQIALAAFIVATLVCIGGILDGRRWAIFAEWLRLTALVAAAIYLAIDHYGPGHSDTTTAILASVAVGVGFAAWLIPYRHFHLEDAAPDTPNFAAWPHSSDSLDSIQPIGDRPVSPPSPTTPADATAPSA